MLSIIACISKNRAIGYHNQLLYHIKSDMTRFRELTTGHTVIMGRHTYESLPHGALPNRRNIVVSRTLQHLPDCEIQTSLEGALNAARTPFEEQEEQEGKDVHSQETFVIGGDSLYHQALPLADRLYLTVVEDQATHADAFFPILNPAEWIETEKEIRNENNIAFSFLTYNRR